MKKALIASMAVAALSPLTAQTTPPPAKIDISRDTSLHSAFGVGPHRCIGSNLARLELKTFLEEWLKRIPDFGMKPGSEPTYETGFLRTMTKLELVF